MKHKAKPNQTKVFIRINFCKFGQNLQKSQIYPKGNVNKQNEVFSNKDVSIK